MMIARFIVLTAMLFTCGCATMKESIIVGASSGAALGAGTGLYLAEEDAVSSAITGGLIGAAIGGVAAYFIHGSLESRDRNIRKDTLFNLEQFGVSDVPSASSKFAPAISFPVLEEQAIKTHREGNKVIEGHRVWLISEDTNVFFNNEGKIKEDK